MFNRCKKYFKTESNTLDVKGIKTKVNSLKLAEIEFGLDQISLKNDYVKATDRLYELDLKQYILCKAIKNIKDKEKRDEKQVEYVDLLMEMFEIAKNPEKAEEIEKKGKSEKNEKGETTMEQLKELLNKFHNPDILDSILLTCVNVREKYPDFDWYKFNDTRGIVAKRVMLLNYFDTPERRAVLYNCLEKNL